MKSVCKKKIIDINQFNVEAVNIRFIIIIIRYTKQVFLFCLISHDPKFLYHHHHHRLNQVYQLWFYTLLIKKISTSIPFMLLLMSTFKKLKYNCLLVINEILSLFIFFTTFSFNHMLLFIATFILQVELMWVEILSEAFFYTI